MTRNNNVVDELWEAAARCFPDLSPEDQQIGLALLRELGRGEPVAVSQFAQALRTSIERASALVKDSVLSPFIHTDEAGRIQGFMGLAVIRTHHQLTVNGRTLWTWCAYDTLFIPELLGETAAIETRDPETGQLIRLTVSPAGVEAADPAGILASIVRPEAWDVSSASQVMASACHFMFFFASRTSGERWQVKHQETVLVSLDEALALAKRSNAHLFGAELARWRGSAM